MAVQAPYTALCRSLVFLMAATGLVVAARWPPAYDHYGWDGVVTLGAGLGLVALLYGWRIQAMETVNATAAESE